MNRTFQDLIHSLDSAKLEITEAWHSLFEEAVARTTFVHLGGRHPGFKEIARHAKIIYCSQSDMRFIQVRWEENAESTLLFTIETITEGTVIVTTVTDSDEIQEKKQQLKGMH